MYRAVENSGGWRLKSTAPDSASGISSLFLNPTLATRIPREPSISQELIDLPCLRFEVILEQFQVGLNPCPAVSTPENRFDLRYLLISEMVPWFRFVRKQCWGSRLSTRLFGPPSRRRGQNMGYSLSGDAKPVGNLGISASFQPQPCDLFSRSHGLTSAVF
jgi:hypothetical protein